jgi:NADPH-dependent 2,4-dienoyl-CoA reductase/sulfur reductase-like enzyme
MHDLPISPWIQRPPDVTEPLCGERRADVAVIGGGYTGLSTAIALRREGADVAVVARDVMPPPLIRPRRPCPPIARSLRFVCCSQVSRCS